MKDRTKNAENKPMKPRLKEWFGAEPRKEFRCPMCNHVVDKQDKSCENCGQPINMRAK